MNTVIVRNAAQISSELQQLDLPKILLQIYANRNVTAEQLNQELKNLLPYHQLHDIDKAADCLFQAIRQQQRILIVGDYDVDGATSTALMMRALRQFGAKNIDYLIPDRFVCGYGLTPKIIELAAKFAPDLIVTVDNGIANIDGVVAANAAGIKVLITDHHLCGRELPPATAIVNPNQPNDKFPSKNLAGVGVAFYVLLALRAKLREESWFVLQNIKEPNLADYLDLVALGTIADMVKLDRNNRILVQQGLRRVQAGKCCIGIRALLQIAGCSDKKLTATDLGYSVCPRLNAAGRLDDMAIGVKCLLTNNKYEAKSLAQQLNSLNNQRRNIDKKMQQEALADLENYNLTENKDLPLGICLLNEKWHQGVLGILASRLKERLHRPVIAFSLDEQERLKGSARSVVGLHIRDLLDEISQTHPELLLKFGGHAQAAGLTIMPENFNKFAQVFDNIARRHLTADNLQNKLYSDGELSADDFSLELVQALNNAGPWGHGFAEPLFDNKFKVLQQKIVGGSHLRLMLQLDNRRLPAIAFNVDTNRWPNNNCEQIYAAYRLDINEYQGDRNLQLVIHHLEAR